MFTLLFIMPRKEYLDEIKKKQFQSKQDFIKFRTQILPKFQTKQIIDGVFESKGIFVGEYGYPSVNVGLLSTSTFDTHENIPHWIKESWSLSQIAEKRMDLLNAKSIAQIKQTKDITEKQEVALAKRAVSTEMNFDNKSGKLSFSNYHMPVGPSRELEKLTLTSNAKIDSRVQKVVSDTDLKATEGLSTLYKKGFRPEFLTQALTSGSLGIDRKMVPTRWGITAVDDAIGKDLLKKVRDFGTTGNLVFQGSYMGNYFFVLLYEGSFSYELFEFFRDTGSYSTDYEDFTGRKNYAKDTAGGYYATRLPILEWMRDNKRKSKALVVRFITDEYYMPLGVWVVREAVTKTMSSKPLEFGSEELMFSYLCQVSKKKFGRELDWLDKTSKLLAELKQKNLNEY